jgi:hypothetical protein
MKADDVLKPRIGPIMGGLIVDPTRRQIRELQERLSKVEAKLFQNSSGCCCKFDEDGETIIDPCLAHKLWKKVK